MEGNKRTRRRRHSGLERLKSLLILLLTLSAVALTYRVLMYSDFAGTAPKGWLGGLLSLFSAEQTPSVSENNPLGQAGAAAQPVRIAVCDGSDRYAIQYDAAQVERLFDSVSILLSEALSSAEAPQPVDEAAWRSALQAPGIWLDYLGKIPLEALYAWMGEGGRNDALTATARQLAVALDEDGVMRLYYHNEDDGLYYACQTDVTYAGHADELLSGYGRNGLAFVFELGEDSGYTGLDPYVLISTSVPNPPVYRASNPMASADEAMVAALQAAVSFQTSSDSLYQTPDGLRFRIGLETLEIRNDGTVTYHAPADGAARYPIGTEEGYTISELVECTRRLAADTVGRYCGSARVYLMEVTQSEDGITEVCYGYVLNGSAVLLPEDSCAARFTVQNGQITDYTLRFRSYEETSEHSLLLPERQAAAALDALAPEGRELSLCYTDNGGDTVQAGWAAR